MDYKKAKEILTLDITKKPWLRYWGGPVEEFYLTLIGKYNVHVDIMWEIYTKYGTDKNNVPKDLLEKAEESQKLMDMYGNLIDLTIKQYPHLKDWWRELAGYGLLGVC